MYKILAMVRSWFSLHSLRFDQTEENRSTTSWRALVHKSARSQELLEGITGRLEFAQVKNAKLRAYSSS